MKKLLALALLTPTAAMAHPGHGFGFDAGVLHPLTGADHLLAMVGVGLWAAQQTTHRWALPAAFLAAMVAAYALPLLMVAVEPMILASVILLGLAVSLALRAPLRVTVPLVALMGLAHGTAHAAEGTGTTFALGMIATTAALHALGAALGLTLNRLALRLTGALTLLAGLGLAMAG
jgi:urease accessory protein